ncbi:MAG TPA: hypothetical protein VMA31_06400 [Bryobacteraceae bacterium]|nr:hypothetical protein [Bryobacteraceae bacterium]
MRLSNLFLISCLAGGMAILTGPAVADALPESCTSSATTALSADVNVQKEANSLFQDIRDEAIHARFRADRLRAENRSNQVDWVVQGDQLTLLRHNVNVMGAKLCKLQSIESGLAPWQQTEIQRIAAVLPLMADNTTDAINFLNAHQDELWLPGYHVYFHNLYSEARQVAHTSHEGVKETRLMQRQEVNPAS